MIAILKRLLIKLIIHQSLAAGYDSNRVHN